MTTIILAAVLFIAITLVGTLLGQKMWAKPKEAIERVTSTGVEIHEEMPTHPSLVFRDMLNRLGEKLPTSPKASREQKRLIRAGLREGRTRVYKCSTGRRSPWRSCCRQ